MKITRHTIAIAIVTAFAILAIAVLLTTGHNAPDYLSYIALAGIAALAGVALPTGTAPAQLDDAAQQLLGDLGHKLDTILEQSKTPAPAKKTKATGK